MKDKIKIAFGSVPKDGGTFSFYRNIRPQLKNYGIQLYCVAVGKEQAKLWENSYSDENTILLAKDTYNIKKQSQEFVNWCIKNNINMVMGINSEAILSSIPHLPQEIRIMSRCANAFDHGYRITLSGKERLQAIFAITPRLKNDLIELYNANPKLIHLIPNGIDPKPFEIAAKNIRGKKPILQLGFLGRLEHNQKGIFHIPNIIQKLDKLGIPFHLKIAGKGVDKIKLEKKLNPWIKQNKIEFVGSLKTNEIPKFLKCTDLFIFPSHFEGCPNALLEAMMAGCIPLSWNLHGITDYIIKPGITGFIHDMGDYDAMAINILNLHRNRNVLNQMSQEVSRDARSRFDPTIIAKEYSKVFHEVYKRPPINIEKRPWKDFKIDSNFHQLGDPWIPRWLKINLKVVYKKLLKIL